MNQDSTPTGALAKAIQRNHKKAGIVTLKGHSHLQQALNRNRLQRGLEQKEYNPNPNEETTHE